MIIFKCCIRVSYMKIILFYYTVSVYGWKGACQVCAYAPQKSYSESVHSYYMVFRYLLPHIINILSTLFKITIFMYTHCNRRFSLSLQCLRKEETLSCYTSKQRKKALKRETKNEIKWNDNETTHLNFCAYKLIFFFFSNLSLLLLYKKCLCLPISFIKSLTCNIA